MPVTPTAVVNTPAKYHSLEPGEVPFNTYQAIRLLCDKVYSMQDRLVAAEATISSLVTLVNSLESQLASARTAADGALAIRQEP